MNEDFVKNKQLVIETACKNICKHSAFWKDLAQEVSIYFLTNKLPDNLNKIDGFIFVVAYKMFHLSGSEFNRLHIDHLLKDYDNIDEIKGVDLNYTPSMVENTYRDYLDQVEQLDDMERIWVEEILKRNLSIKLFSEHTGIHRATATERMNSIYEKLRKNNK